MRGTELMKHLLKKNAHHRRSDHLLAPHPNAESGFLVVMSSQKKISELVVIAPSTTMKGNNRRFNSGSMQFRL